jgi:hypothetical protein
MKQDENCKSCVFCLINDNGQPECRRRSPIALPTQQKSPLANQVQMAIVTLWPPVKAELWCGDHMPAPPISGLKA